MKPLFLIFLFRPPSHYSFPWWPPLSNLSFWNPLVVLYSSSLLKQFILLVIVFYFPALHPHWLNYTLTFIFSVFVMTPFSSWTTPAMSIVSSSISWFPIRLTTFVPASASSPFIGISKVRTHWRTLRVARTVVVPSSWSWHYIILIFRKIKGHF